jgi:hypothetical protein
MAILLSKRPTELSDLGEWERNPPVVPKTPLA